MNLIAQRKICLVGVTRSIIGRLSPHLDGKSRGHKIGAPKSFEQISNRSIVASLSRTGNFAEGISQDYNLCIRNRAELKVRGLATSLDQTIGTCIQVFKLFRMPTYFSKFEFLFIYTLIK